MSRSRKTFWAVIGMATLPTPAAAQPEDICGVVQRIAAGARERPAFRSIRRELADGQTVVPGFAAHECRATAFGLECRGTRHGGGIFHGWPDLTTCRGVVAVERPRLSFPSNRSYRLGRFQIHRGVRCPGCRALGPPFFTMTLDRPGEQKRSRHAAP